MFGNTQYTTLDFTQGKFSIHLIYCININRALPSCNFNNKQCTAKFSEIILQRKHSFAGNASKYCILAIFPTSEILNVQYIDDTHT